MKQFVIFDTDIGYDPDDFFALLLALNSSELNIDMVLTGDEVNGKRAVLTREILDKAGVFTIPVLVGADLGKHHRFIVDELIKDAKPRGEQTQALFDSYMMNMVKSYDQIVYLGLQGMTNLADLIRHFPGAKEKFKVYQMGGAIDYERQPGWVEHNVRVDPDSARYVLNSGIDIHLVQAQTTYNMTFLVDDKSSIFKRLKESHNPVHKMLLRHVEIFNKEKSWWPLMHDPLTVSVALGYDFVDFYESPVYMNEAGQMTKAEEGPKIKLSHKKTRDKEFMEFLEERLFFSKG